MTTNTPPDLTATTTSRMPWGLLALVIAAGAIVYVNSFPGVFVLDDLPGIVDNASVHDCDGAGLRRWRPVTNVTLAFNYAVGGLDVRGYHAVNLIVHLLAACTLFGLVRRTLLLPGTRERFANGASWIAFAIALLWVVHPLQTDSVTYIIQRAGALAGLFALLTLYCVARGAGARRGLGWYAGAILACALGMGSKAVVVTLPAIVLLYDRVFLTASLAEIARRRWALYAGLAATWGVLVWSGVIGAILSPGDAGTSVGFGYDGITPLAYLAAEPGVMLHYLRLVVWPAPLAIDYWWQPPASTAAMLVPAIVVLVLLGATVFALRRWPRTGFLGAAFFLLLAPTSSIVPSRDLAFEHRMYLALATVLALIVLGVQRFLARPDSARFKPAAVLVLVLVAAGLGAGTVLRNRDYHSTAGMWRSVMEARPENPRAPQNLGTALADEDRLDEAIVAYHRALEFPDFRTTTYLSIAQTQRRAGRIDQAIEAYTLAIEGDPTLTAAQHTLANLLVARGRIPDAIPHFDAVIAQEPDNAEAHADLGRTYAALNDLPSAIRHLERAAELAPENPQVHNNLGGVYALQGRLQQALDHVIEAIRLDPDYREAVENLGRIMVRAADPEAIVERNRERVNLDAALALTWAHRGDIALSRDLRDDAISAYKRALEIEPTLEQARSGLAKALAEE